MTKEEKYRQLLESATSMLGGETDIVSMMANLCALLHNEFGFWWTGFYRVVSVNKNGSSDSELLLGPFQGPVACMHIAYGRGVCGTAWKERHTIVVPDVEQFPGHIACSSESRSEIVVPVFCGNEVVAVLDIDSRELSTFDETDARCLEQLLAKVFPPAPTGGWCWTL